MENEENPPGAPFHTQSGQAGARESALTATACLTRDRNTTARHVPTHLQLPIRLCTPGTGWFDALSPERIPKNCPAIMRQSFLYCHLRAGYSYHRGSCHLTTVDFYQMHAGNAPYQAAAGSEPNILFIYFLNLNKNKSARVLHPASVL